MELAERLFGAPDTTGRLGWLVRANEVLRGLAAMGWQWDWVNDGALQQAVASYGKLKMRDREYKAVVVLDTQSMPVATAKTLARLARAGVPVVVAGKAPDRDQGYFDHLNRDLEVDSSMRVVLSKGLGCEATAAAIDGLLRGQHVRPMVRFLTPNPALRQVARVSGPASVVFFANQGDQPVTTELALDLGCLTAQWLDPITGGLWSIPNSPTIGLKLEPYESRLLLCDYKRLTFDDQPWTYDAKPVREVTDWTISDGKSTIRVEKLKSLHEIEGFEHVDSVVTYRAGFEAGEAGGYCLNLGRVEGVATVKVNGHDLGRYVLPPFRVQVPDSALNQGTNQIEIQVRVPLRNWMVWKAGQGGKEYAQFANHVPMPAGLIGPVRLCERSETGTSKPRP